MVSFTKDPLYKDDIVVYLKNERTGSSTIRKCKFIGQIVDINDSKAKIMRLSSPDRFVTPDEIKELGIDTVCAEEIVHIIISKHDLDKERWISVKECMPNNEEEVEITFTRKHYLTGEMYYLTARAFYEDGTLNTEDSNFVWEIGSDWEYDNEKDAYIIPEGWWEYVKFSEEFGPVDQPVIAWRPIGIPYKT